MKRLVAAALLLLAGTARAAVQETLLVSTDWLAQHRRDRNLTLVHVGRDTSVYDAGHIPGAVFLPLANIAPKRGELTHELPPADDLQKTLENLGIGEKGRIIIYGDDALLAARLFFTLDYAGHGERAALLDGGLDAWKRESRDLEKIPNVPKPKPVTLRLQPDRLVYLSQVRMVVPSDAVTLLDARPPAQFTGKEPGEEIVRAGHIPSARNLFWKDLVAEDGRILPAAELKEKVNAPTDKPVVTYCRTGMQASFEYFVLRYLGYTPSLYDGGYSEWSRDGKNEVAR